LIFQHPTEKQLREFLFMLSVRFLKTVKTVAWAAALCSLSQPVRADDPECDPTRITNVIELAHMEGVDVSRAPGLFWLNVTPHPDISDLPEELVDEKGAVRASAIQVILKGRDCSVLVEEARVNVHNQWRRLRLAGENIFAPNSFSHRFSVGPLQIGLNLVLMQHAHCDITVNALVYARTNPFLRPYPSPDPEC